MPSDCPDKGNDAKEVKKLVITNAKNLRTNRIIRCKSNIWHGLSIKKDFIHFVQHKI